MGRALAFGRGPAPKPSDYDLEESSLTEFDDTASSEIDSSEEQGVVRHHRRLPFAQVPEALILDTRVPDRSVRLWCLLSRYAGESGRAFPGRRRLAEQLGCSIPTISRALSDLVEAGWITRTRRPSMANIWDTEVYDEPNTVESEAIRRGGSVAMRLEREPTEREVDQNQVQSQDQNLLVADVEMSDSGAETTPGADAPLSEVADAPSDELTAPQGLRDVVPASQAQELDQKTPGGRTARAMCDLLVSLMVANGSKPPTITKQWLDAARLMIDTDGRDPAKAAILLRWCQQDEFWRANIHSMPKFRAQYDQLRLKALAEWEARQRPSRPSTTDQRVADVMRLKEQMTGPDGQWRN
jgi:Helix-turn-helix domain